MWLYIYLHTDRLGSGSAVTDGRDIDIKMEILKSLIFLV